MPNGEINVAFLKGFKKTLAAQAKKGWKFVIVVGGGGTCRTYQRAAKEVTRVTPEDLDWLGIHATRLNGHLIRTIFRDIAHPVMYKDPARVPIRFVDALSGGKKFIGTVIGQSLALTTRLRRASLCGRR